MFVFETKENRWKWKISLLLLLKFFTRHWGWAIPDVFSNIVIKYGNQWLYWKKIGLSRFFSNKQLELSGKTRYFEEKAWKSRLSGFFMEKQWAIGNSQFKINWLSRILGKKPVQVLLFKAKKVRYRTIATVYVVCCRPPLPATVLIIKIVYTVPFTKGLILVSVSDVLLSNT